MGGRRLSEKWCERFNPYQMLQQTDAVKVFLNAGADKDATDRKSSLCWFRHAPAVLT